MASLNKFTGESQHFELKYGCVGRYIGNPTKNNTNADIANKKDNAFMIILCGLSKEIASQYTSIENPFELWETLQSVYNSNTATTRSEIRKQFQSLTLDKCNSLSHYIESINLSLHEWKLWE